MPRRGDSIYKRADGRWEARYIHHYENGQAKYRFVYGHTYTEAKEKRIEELKTRDLSKPCPVKSITKFGQLSSEWLKQIQFTVKESTYTRYHRIVTRYLNPKLGQIQLCKLDTLRLKAFFVDLSERGGMHSNPLSDRTVSSMFTVFKSIYKYGREKGYPCADLSTITPKSTTRNKVSVLSNDDFIRLQEKLLNSCDRVSLGILFTLYTGIRIGELCGLRYEDIDLTTGTVKIERSVERIANLSNGAKTKTKKVISTPKTGNSCRIIPLLGFLKEYIEKLPGDPNCYLLTGTTTCTEPRLFYSRYVNYLANANIPRHTFHELRHTFATNCIACGFDAKTLSEILGHANVSTTLAFYVHPTFEQKKEMMEKLVPLHNK